MGKKVLVAVDLGFVSDASLAYGIQLAARTESSLTLLAISAPEPTRKRGLSRMTPEDLESGHKPWLDRIMGESRERSVGLEVFVTSGRFFEEVIRFVRSRTGVQFIVMAAPREREEGDGAKFRSLKRLHEEFEGEILLVEKAGQITKVSDRYSSCRNTCPNLQQ
jgi:hypothetical protein